MREVKFYFDKRRPSNDGLCLLKLRIGKGSERLYFPLNVSLKADDWDEENEKVVNHKDAERLNKNIIRDKQNVEDTLLLAKNKKLTRNELKKLVKNALNPQDEEKEFNRDMLFAYNFQKYANLQNLAKNTKEIYNGTYRHLQKFMGEELENLAFEDITYEWLVAFDDFLKSTSPAKNARNIHLRNIRTVVKYANDNGITKNYPFHRYKITPEETPKRALTVKELHQLFNYPVEKHQQKYLDIFKLLFFLRGINLTDLYKLKETNLVKGRIEYHRSKTNTLYSIKVEPEAIEIIEKYKGKTALLNIADHSTYKNYLHRINDNLKLIGEVKRVGRGGKKVYQPLFHDLTTYWARYSWASIAADMDIPDAIISVALGHKSIYTMTDKYINRNQKKVDEANRKVIDYVLKGK